MAAAALTADYRSPRLAQHARGDALSQLVRGLYANQQHGLIAKGNPVTHPSVSHATPPNDPTSVDIRDCFDDTHWLNYVAVSGALQNNSPGGKHVTSATVTKANSVWKVAKLAVGAVGTC